MSARDTIHNAVRNALVKDGWTITADPYIIQFETIRAQVDLEAEAPLEAENGNRRILVEIKSFLDQSAVHAFGRALGQYEFYRYLKRLTGLPHDLYLAVSEEIYHSVMERDGIREIVELSGLALIVVNIEREEIVQWAE